MSDIAVIARHVDCPWQVDGHADPQRAYCRDACPLRPDCIWRRRALVVQRTPAERVGKQIQAAAEVYERQVGEPPEFAFLQAMPRGGEDGTVVGTAMLIQAAWVPEMCVALWSGALR